MLAEMVVVVDTREQLPYEFSRQIRKALPAGDYSIEGYESKIAIERKTKQDAYSTIGQGRKRFEKELDKLKEYDYSAIVLECSMEDFLIQPSHSKLNPRSAINSLIAWSIRYSIHIFFAGNRILSQTLTTRILEKYYKEQRGKNGNN